MSNSQNIHQTQELGPDGMIMQNWSTTKVKTVTLHYKWIIDHFSFHEAKGECLLSPIFTAANNKECKWQLKLKPNGDTDAKDTISLHLRLKSTSECEKVFANYKLSILDDKCTKKNEIRSPAVRVFDANCEKPFRGFNLFSTKDELRARKLLQNDKLNIFCEVTYSKGDVYTETFDQEQSFDHSGGLSEDFELLLKNREFTDVVLSVDGKDYQAHTVILSARSPVFAAMFKHNLKERRNNRVEITDFKEKTVEEMLHYVYTGKSKNLEQLAENVLAIADKYDLTGLKEGCEKVLYKKLSIENAANTLVLADLHHACELKSKTLNFIVEKSSEVMSTTSWDNIVSCKPYLVNEVCKALSRKLTAESANETL